MISSMRVEARDGARTGIVVVNSFHGSGAPRAMRAQLQVHDATGRCRQVRLPPIAPLASRLIWIDEYIPELSAYLGGRPGHASMLLPFPASRVLTFTDYNAGERRVVNHGTVQHGYSQNRGTPSRWTMSPVASLPVVVDDRLDTRFYLINTWGPDEGPFEVTFRFYSTSGVLWGEHREMLARSATREVSARRVLEQIGIVAPVIANAEVTLRPILQSPERPAIFDVLVGVIKDGALAGEALMGGGFLNSLVPPGVPLVDIRRTRIFTRVRLQDQGAMRIHLANPSADPEYDVTANATVRLFGLEGEEVGVHELSLAPHGCALVDVREAFSRGLSERGPAFQGSLRVRSTEARLIGTHMIDDGSSSVVVDHLVGG
jgi:hypothetical protein